MMIHKPNIFQVSHKHGRPACYFVLSFLVLAHLRDPSLDPGLILQGVVERLFFSSTTAQCIDLVKPKSGAPGLDFSKPD